MPRRLTLDAWTRALEEQIAALRPAIDAALEGLGAVIARAAQEKIGEYQSAAGPFPAWAPLAESTVQQKTRLGYAPPDAPLLRTGDLRTSISFEASPMALLVGSDSPIARYQELGTSRIPPRSFLGAAMFEAQPVVIDKLGAALAGVLSMSERR